MSASRGPTIRGRDPELAALGARLHRLRSGSGSVVLIEGAAGMGKSRLIGEAVSMARRLSLSAGIGVAEPAENVAALGAASPCAIRRTRAAARPRCAEQLARGPRAAVLAAAGSAVAPGTRRHRQPDAHLLGRRALGRQRHGSRATSAAAASGFAPDRMGAGAAPGSGPRTGPPSIRSAHRRRGGKACLQTARRARRWHRWPETWCGPRPTRL